MKGMNLLKGEMVLIRRPSALSPALRPLAIVKPPENLKFFKVIQRYYTLISVFYKSYFDNCRIAAVIFLIINSEFAAYTFIGDENE